MGICERPRPGMGPPWRWRLSPEKVLREVGRTWGDTGKRGVHREKVTESHVGFNSLLERVAVLEALCLQAGVRWWYAGRWCRCDVSLSQRPRGRACRHPETDSP